jgi:hypothetical protein
MNIIELMYLNMRPFDEDILNNMGVEQYVRECRTLRMDNGRQTGKTSNLCEFVAKYDFANVCFVCHNSNVIPKLKELLKLYDGIYNSWRAKNLNVEFISYNKLIEGKFRGIRYDAIIFDTYSFYKTKLKFNYGPPLKKGGIIIKVG